MSVCLLAKTQNNHFGKNRMITALYSYLPSYSDNINVSTHAALNLNFAFSISEKLYSGLYYHRLSQCVNDFNTISNDIFHKGGLLLRYKEDMFNNKVSLNMDITFGYSNYSVNPTDDVNDRADFIDHNNYQIGINFIVDIRMYKSLFLSGGFVNARTLKKGDYGIDAFPMLGLSGRF